MLLCEAGRGDPSAATHPGQPLPPRGMCLYSRIPVARKKVAGISRRSRIGAAIVRSYAVAIIDGRDTARGQGLPRVEKCDCVVALKDIARPLQRLKLAHKPGRALSTWNRASPNPFDAVIANNPEVPVHLPPHLAGADFLAGLDFVSTGTDSVSDEYARSAERDSSASCLCWHLSPCPAVHVRSRLFRGGTLPVTPPEHTAWAAQRVWTGRRREGSMDRRRRPQGERWPTPCFSVSYGREGSWPGRRPSIVVPIDTHAKVADAVSASEPGPARCGGSSTDRGGVPVGTATKFVTPEDVPTGRGVRATRVRRRALWSRNLAPRRHVRSR